MYEQMANYKRGEVAVSGELTHLYGQIKEFPDKDWDSSEAVKPTNTGIPVRCKWVKNGDASAITARLCLKWDTATSEPGSVVIPAGDDDPPCGVADEFMSSAGAATGEGFWMVIEGPTELISDGGSTLATTDEVVTAASGKVNKQTAAPADTTAAMVQVNSRVGRPMLAVTNVDGTTFRAIVGPFMA